MTNSRTVALCSWPTRWPSNANSRLMQAVESLHALGWRIWLVHDTPEEPGSEAWKPWLAQYVDQVKTRAQLLDSPVDLVIGFCDPSFFDLALQCRARSMKVAWFNEMTYYHKGEIEMLEREDFDVCCYISEEQRSALHLGETPSLIIGGTIKPEDYPCTYRNHINLVCGRVSRPVLEKFPLDFGQTCSWLPPGSEMRVMGWNPELALHWPQETFGPPWVMQPQNAVPVRDFWADVDVCLFYHHPASQESFCYLVLEAMMSGAIPVTHDYLLRRFWPNCPYRQEILADVPAFLRSIWTSLSYRMRLQRAAARQARLYVTSHPILPAWASLSTLLFNA